MDELFTILIVIIFVAALIYIRAEGRRGAAIRIHNYVQKRGGIDVKLTDDHDGDRHSWTFKVSYRDSHGVQHTTKGKVRQKVGDNNSPIYWLEELCLPDMIGKKMISAEQSTVLPAPPSSAKEQIISDLTAENEHLRDELEKLRRTDPT